MAGPALPLALLVDPLRVIGLLDECPAVRGERQQPRVGLRLGGRVRLLCTGVGAGVDGRGVRRGGRASARLTLPQPLRGDLGAPAVHLEGEATALLGAQVPDVRTEQDGGHSGRPEEREPADRRDDRAEREGEEEHHGGAPAARERLRALGARGGRLLGGRAPGDRRPTAGRNGAAFTCGLGALLTVVVRGLGRRIARRFTRHLRTPGLRTPRPSFLPALRDSFLGSVLSALRGSVLSSFLDPLLDRRLHLRAGRRHGEGPDVHRCGDGVRSVGVGLPSSVERARRSLAYRRSIPARPDSSRMAVLKRSVGRASFSSSCLRSHIGTK